MCNDIITLSLIFKHRRASDVSSDSSIDRNYIALPFGFCKSSRLDEINNNNNKNNDGFYRLHSEITPFSVTGVTAAVYNRLPAVRNLSDYVNRQYLAPPLYNIQ